MRVRVRGDLFRGAGGDDAAAAVAALGAQIHDPVGGLDHVQVVFDHHHRVALVAQPVQHRQQVLDVVEVQPGGGLVEQVQSAPGVASRELLRQFHPLRLAARQRGGRLAELDVAQAHVHQRFQLARERRHRFEQVQRVLDSHVEDFVDVAALVADLQGFAVVALALAHVTGHVDVGQEVHFDLDQAVTLAGLAAAAANVEGEPPRRVTACARLGHLREQLAQRCEQAGVGGRVAARGAPDRRLVDVHHLVEQVHAVALAVRRHGVRGTIELVAGQRLQGVVDQRGLARTGHAGDAGQQARRDLQIDVLEVVAARAQQPQHQLRVGRVPMRGNLDGAASGQEIAGRRFGCGQDVLQLALRHHAAAVDAGTGADVDDVVGAADRILVVFDHDHRIAQVAQPHQRAQQALVVALVQADRGFVEHVHHPHQAGADLRGQADALRLAAGERVGLAVQGEVVEPDIHQEAQALADLLDDLGRDFAAPAVQIKRRKEVQRRVHRQPGHLRQVASGDEDVARRAIQARAGAILAGAVADVLGQFLTNHLRLGFAVAAFQVGQDAFELVLALGATAGLGEVGKTDDGFATAVQYRRAHIRGQLLPRRVHVEAVVACQRGDQLEVVGIAAIPAAHGTCGKAQFGVADHARRVEELGHAQAVAGRARAGRRVERKQPRLQLGQRVVADRAGELAGEQHFGGLRSVHVDHGGDALAELERGFHALGQALLEVLARAETVHHRVDAVLDPQRERRHLVDLVNLSVHPQAHVALRTQLVDHLHVLALALADHRRQQHPAVLGVEREDGIDHLADGLRLQRIAVLGTVRRAHPRVEQAQVVMDLGDRAHGRTRVVRGGLLLDRDRRRQALDVVHVGLFHHRQELPRVGRQRLDVTALAFGVDGVEGQRGLARTGQPGDHHQRIARQVEVDVLQIVGARSADADRVQAGHALSRRESNRAV